MAAPVNTITYGSFTFPFSSLTMTSQVQYAEDGFTQVGTRYEFNVSGIIGGISQGDLQTQIIAMETTLRTPRQQLDIQWSGDGGSTLYSFDNTGSDLDWGPKPGSLDLMRFSGGRSAVYRWSVVVTSKSTQCQLKTDVLALTWRFENNIDVNGYTTRTVSGKLLVTSNTVQNGQPADAYRYVIIDAIPTPLWFRRISQDFVQSEDGRILSFSIVDKEEQWTFPPPVTNGAVSWTSRIAGMFEGSGLLADYVLSGYFETSAAHTKFELWTQVLNLIAIKFGAISGTLVPGERTVKEDVYGNRIDFTITAKGAVGTLPGGDTPDYSSGINTFFNAPPGSNGISQLMNPYGQTDNLSSGVPIDGPSDYDACNNTANNYNLGGNNSTIGQTGRTDDQGRQTSNSGGAPDNKTDGISKIQLDNPFIAFSETISYECDNRIVTLIPKQGNVQPFVQQTGAPQLTVIQAGYFKQVAQSAGDIQPPNKPVFSDTEAKIVHWYISPPVPEPLGDGTYNVYTIEWRYVMTYTKYLQGMTQIEMVFPNDPRRPLAAGSTTNGGSLPNTLPPLIQLPDA